MNTQINLFTPTTSGIELVKANARAGSQIELIADLMSDGVKRTSVQVHDLTGINLNSVRRSLTQLTQSPYYYLKKLDEMKMERFGSNNHFYKLLNH